MNPWLVMLLSGLAAMKVTEMLKEILPWPLQAWTKSALSILLATGGSALLLDTWGPGRLVAFGLGSAGLASLGHELGDLMGLATDNYKQQVILRSQPRRRRETA